jgi:hypothetical protein
MVRYGVHLATSKNCLQHQSQFGQRGDYDMQACFQHKSRQVPVSFSEGC